MPKISTKMYSSQLLLISSVVLFGILSFIISTHNQRDIKNLESRVLKRLLLANDNASEFHSFKANIEIGLIIQDRDVINESNKSLVTIIGNLGKLMQLAPEVYDGELDVATVSKFQFSLNHFINLSLNSNLDSNEVATASLEIVKLKNSLAELFKKDKESAVNEYLLSIQKFAAYNSEFVAYSNFAIAFFVLVSIILTFYVTKG